MTFALALFVLLVVTGVIALADRIYFARRRAKDAAEPWWIEYPKSFFPVILVVFVLRSFIVEPFKIPTGSMIPTLLVGDYILVNKFAYGIRLPVINKKIIEIGQPRRGDVMVFRYPEDPSQDYIKRVIGVPGDTVQYLNKRLTINGEVMPVNPAGDYLNRERMSYAHQYSEQLGNVNHMILIEEDAPPMPPYVRAFPLSENCSYNSAGFTCKIPAGHYFMMGDNRDNSLDSRVWGFVPDENIVGKAFFVWWNFGEPGRIGRFK